MRGFFHLLACVAILATGHANARCPAVGAIRWDAWFGAQGKVGQAVERSLSPKQWHERLPTCARVVEADKVAIHCDGQAQMDAEIEQAVSAGIGYWAFVAYADDNPMSLGLKTYLQSATKKKPGFALIADLASWRGSTIYEPVLKRYVKLMGESSYQRTPQGRPIFFQAFVSEESLNSRFGGRAGFAKVVSAFREASVAAGIGDPYIVLMDGNVARAKGFIADLGMDAVSAYAVSDIHARAADYKLLAQRASRFWSQAQDAGLPVVPIVMTGWDRRPRVLNPMPWENYDKATQSLDRYYKQPSPAELTAHLSDAIRFAALSDSAAAQAVLVYAWNEFDEGGWLAPTAGGGNARLNAVRAAVQQACPLR
jgi:hypothetical protein